MFGVGTDIGRALACLVSRSGRWAGIETSLSKDREKVGALLAATILLFLQRRQTP